MKKIRKILSVFLALVMAVSVLAGTGVQVQAAASKQVVYFNNSVSDWSSVYAYVWGTGLTTKAIKGTKVADDVYKMEIPAEYSKILFKNTSGTSNWDKKTANTTIPTDGKNCFKPKSSSNKSNGTWSTYKEITATPKVTTTIEATAKAEAKDETVTFYYDNSKTKWSGVHAYVWGGDTTKTVQGTSIGNNVYSFAVSSNYQNVLFKNTAGTSSWDKQTADAGKAQAGKIFTPASSANKTGGTWNDYTTAEPTATPTVTPVDYMSFSYDNTKTKWSDVYVYAWVEGDNSVTPVIEKSIACIENDVYYFKVPTTYKNILFKNVDSTSVWDQQTVDTVMPTEYCQRFFTYSGANKTGGYWKEVLPYTTTPPVPVTTAPVTTAPVTTPPVSTVTFYYDNSKTSWSDVHAYVWGGDTTTTVQGTKAGDNVYSFTVSSSYQNVLFKNTAGTSSWDRQTADAGKAQAGKIFTPSSSANKTGGSWNDYIPASPTPTPTPVTYTKVGYDNSKTNWSNVYAYVWVEADRSVTPVALEATSVSGNTYTFEVASTYKNILFKNLPGTSNWDKQTADTTVPTADGYTFITYSGENKTDGYWKENQTSNTKRRALSYGVSDQDGGSTRHYNDAVSSAKMYESFTYDGVAMERVECATNLTISGFKEKVKTTFADTTDDDVSYLSIACHGGSSGSICLGTNWGSMTGAQFRALLDECIKGDVVLILDCCFSGQIIDKEDGAEEFSVEAFLEEFMDTDSKSGELAAERFHVICASSKTESSWGYYDREVAVEIWEEGLGWLEQSSVSTNLKADANGDNKVTLAELYEYSYPLVLAKQPNQHVVVYPENDDFIVGGRY